MLDLRALGAAATGPRGVLRVLQILEHMARHSQGRSLAQLCEDLKLPKTTLFTMLRTLTGHGYLQSDGGVYRLGPPAFALGATLVTSARRGFPECAREELEALCRRSGETALLAVLTADGMHCRYVSVVESGNWLRFSVELDSLRPSYATGTGHAMLAYLPSAEVEAILARSELEKITRKTTASRRALMAALAKVRREHVSATDSGTVAGVLSVAAPIFDAGGRVMAAVSAGGPAERMAQRLDVIQRAARAAAEDISRSQGFAGDWPPA